METKNNTTQVSLSERTRLFVEALKALNNAESQVLSAYWGTYGEEMGDEMVHKLPFDEIRRHVSECMGIVICENQVENPVLI